MTIEYELTADDFLTYQLYTASQSERVRAQRTRSRYLVPICFGIVAGLMIYNRDYIGAIIAVTLATGWYFFAPLLERKRYINHYRYHIRSNYAARFGRPTTLQIEPEFIFAKDEGSETRVSSNDVENIDELPTVILVKLNTGPSFIIPKKGIDSQALAQHLKEMAMAWGVTYTAKPDWKWQ